MSTPAQSPIQGLWIGKLGMLERLSMASFLSHGHQYHLYVYDEPQGLPPGVELHDASAIIPREGIFQYQHGKARGGYSGFANLFRYKLLLEKGGWWCDTDLIALKPFDFTQELIFASERHWLWRPKLCNAVIFAPRAHPLMQATYEEAARIPPQALRHAQNGGAMLARHVARLGLRRFIQPPEVFNPVNWYQCRTIGDNLPVPETSYAVHCYREVWRWHLKEKQDTGFREHIFPPDTLLGALQRRYLPQEC